MKRAIPLSILIAAPALAHGGAHPVPQAQPGWTLDPWIVAPMAAAAIGYGVGMARLWRRADRGRPAMRRDALLFASGWFVLAGAVLSPLHEAGERSFTMHMIEHELIMLMASLLLVSARPGPALLWSLPQGMRHAAGAIARSPLRTAWRKLVDPLVATFVQAVAMWAWHAPALFDRALGHAGWHVAQHLSFLVTSLLFWQAMANAHRERAYGPAAFCLFATSMISGLLGALMSFSMSPWYAGYAAMGMTPYGLTALEDQQLAGLLMWIPGGLVHAAAALYFAYRWLQTSGAGHAARP